MNACEWTKYGSKWAFFWFFLSVAGASFNWNAIAGRFAFGLETWDCHKPTGGASNTEYSRKIRTQLIGDPGVFRNFIEKATPGN
ncbi:MAG TPA: hypothetical protein VM260_05705 [Pirellula sp.]|nr:hypothetical protein [Pirellula sp.]